MTERNIIATVFFYHDADGKVQCADSLDPDWAVFTAEDAVQELQRGHGAVVRPGAKAAVLAGLAQTVEVAA
jgi:hypothetical protein